MRKHMNPICRWPFPVLSFITLAGAAACALASGLPIPEARPAADPSASCGPDSSLPVLEAAGWDPDPAADEKLLADPAANLLTNGGFESVTDGHLSGWRYELRDGAEGSVEFDRSFTRSGAQSLKVTKTNGKGYILVYPEIPIPAKPGDKLSFQGFYHTRDNRSPHQTLGMVRLIQKKDDFTYDQSVDRWLASESQQGLINGRAGQWQKRLGNMEVQAGRSPEVTPCLLIYGNPVTVWWDDFAVEPLAVVSRRYNRAYPRSIELWADETLTDEELDARLAAERDHTARLQPVHGRTVLFVDDEPAAPVVFKNSTYAPQKFRGGELDRVGVRLHMQYISFGTAPRRYPPLEPGKENRGSHPGIVRDKDVYDIDSALDLVRHAMRSSPDSLLLLDLHMHSYDRFVDDHPEEAWRNEAGEPAFGTQAHLLGFSHTLPEGRYRWASFFSPQWQADLEKALTLFLSRLRETDMARRVVGFQITGGHDSQFTYRQLDYSPPAIAAFRNYLRRLYGTDEALAQAWNREVTFETAGVPVILRETDRFLDPASQRDWYDYWRFVQHEIFALQERLARTAKALLAKEVVAIRYQQGTFMGSYAGAYYLNQFFHSDVFDIAAPQPQYPRRRPGVSAANNKAYESHHWNNKLLFKEFDFRTLYFDRGVSEMDDVRLSKATSLNMWEVINRRLVGELMARDHGYWYFDLDWGFFQKDIAAAIGESARDHAKLFQKRLAKPPRQTAELAVVLDEDSLYWTTVGSRYYIFETDVNTRHQVNIIGNSGVPFDFVLLEDLLARPERAEPYKAFVFLHSYRLDPERRAFYDSLKKNNRALIWLYAAGYVGDTNRSVENMAALTGMTIGMSTNVHSKEVFAVPSGHPFARGLQEKQDVVSSLRMSLIGTRIVDDYYNAPYFFAADPDAVTLAAYETGESAVAVKAFPDWTSVYVGTAGGLSAELLNAICREAGAYVCTQPGLDLHLNDDFLCVHGILPGYYTFTLPRRATVRNLKDGAEIVRDADRFQMWVQPQSTYWFGIER